MTFETGILLCSDVVRELIDTVRGPVKRPPFFPPFTPETLESGPPFVFSEFRRFLIAKCRLENGRQAGKSGFGRELSAAGKGLSAFSPSHHNSPASVAFNLNSEVPTSISGWHVAGKSARV